MNDVTAPAPVIETDTQRYIGKPVTRPNVRRLTQGRGQYVDDLVLPRMLHVVYLRSPHAHARIVRIDAKAARRMPGIAAIVDGHAMAKVCAPWVATLKHLTGMRSPPQHALAIDRATWQGEAVLAIVGQTRALAEDALEAVTVEWSPCLPPCTWTPRSARPRR